MPVPRSEGSGAMHFSNGARASHGTAPTRPEPAHHKIPYAEIKKQGGAGVSLAKLKRQG